MYKSLSLTLHYQCITVDFFYGQNGNQIYFLSLPICSYILYEYKGENDAHFSKHYENAHCFLFFLKNVNLPFSVNVKILVCTLYKINRCFGPITQTQQHKCVYDCPCPHW